MAVITPDSLPMENDMAMVNISGPRDTYIKEIFTVAKDKDMAK